MHYNLFEETAKMCGIAGYIDFNKKTGKDILVKMTDVLVHRGPDDSGYEFFSDNEANIGFGFRRLSIIDLSALGHQPMFSEGKDRVIIFNGEIYNYRELRTELEQYGFQFKSNSDTEVVLQSYKKWGKDCVHHFIGMFVIVIYDKPQQKIIFFRDRAGVKPLFYYHKNGLFLFASELKSFHEHPEFEKEIDFNSAAMFFQQLYIPAPHCIFKNCHKLRPGHTLEINLKFKETYVYQFWNVIDFYNKPRLNISFEDAKTETEKLLISSFQYRTVADVPVGIFLSGGYDSSAIAALLQKNSMQKLNTFTIGFNEKDHNEAPYAKKVAGYLGTNHNEYYCTTEEAKEIIPQLPFFYDEPFADHSAIPTILVSKIARSQVKVALSADGGDEIFAGYNSYKKVAMYIPLLRCVPFALRNNAGKLMKNFAPFCTPEIAGFDRYDKLLEILQTNGAVKAINIIRKGMTFNETQRIFSFPILPLHSPFDEDYMFSRHNDVLSRALATDYRSYLMDDILQKVDRATMSVSLEGREPFLDQRIIEFAAQLPSSYKIRNGNGKYILKEIVHKYIPQEIMHRPKMGFGVPVERWCKNELKYLMQNYLNEERIKQEGIFKPEMIRIILKHYFSDKPVAFDRIWCLLMFQMWKEKWVP